MFPLTIIKVLLKVNDEINYLLYLLTNTNDNSSNRVVTTFTNLLTSKLKNTRESYKPRIKSPP